MAAQRTALRQFSIYTNEEKGGFIFKKSEKHCCRLCLLMYTYLEMASNVTASNLVAQLEGHKYKTEIRFAMGLSCWSNLKHQTDYL